MIGRSGWNTFVAHMTGGLLYGHEVERPGIEAPAIRRRAHSTHVFARCVQLRERIIELLLKGFKRHEIAGQLSVNFHCVVSHLNVIYREHGVHSRAELAARLGRTIRPQPAAEAAS